MEARVLIERDQASGVRRAEDGAATTAVVAAGEEGEGAGAGGGVADWRGGIGL
jgi:hypothetical protein